MYSHCYKASQFDSSPLLGMKLQYWTKYANFLLSWNLHFSGKENTQQLCKMLETTITQASVPRQFGECDRGTDFMGQRRCHTKVTLESSSKKEEKGKILGKGLLVEPLF